MCLDTFAPKIKESTQILNLIFLATFSPLLMSRARMMTLAPLLARSKAVASPIPAVAPEKFKVSFLNCFMEQWQWLKWSSFGSQLQKL